MEYLLNKICVVKFRLRYFRFGLSIYFSFGVRRSLFGYRCEYKSIYRICIINSLIEVFFFYFMRK